MNIQDTITRLAAHQERLKLTDSAFARRYLKRSASYWSLVRSGKYPAADDGTAERLGSALVAIADEESVSAREPSTVETTHLRDLLAAIRLAAGERDNKLVVYLAPSGGGKSTAGRIIARTYGQNAVMVTATQTWRDSLLACYLDILRELGDKTDHKTARAAEAALFDRLRKEPRLIVIDKAHYFGARTFNVVEALLSDTPTAEHNGCRVVLLAIPILWHRVVTETAYEEAQQVKRRIVTDGLIRVAAVPADDVTAMADGLLPGFAGLNGDSGRAVKQIAAAANTFGHYDTVARICREAAEEAGVTGTLTLDHITAAITRVQNAR